MQPEADDPGQAREIPVPGEALGIVTQSHGGDEAVDGPSWRHPAPSTGPVDRHRCAEVRGSIEGQEREAVHGSAELSFPPGGTSAGANLHDDRLGDGDGPPSPMRRASVTSTGLPVARSYSTQADESTRITTPAGRSPRIGAGHEDHLAELVVLGDEQSESTIAALGRDDT